MFVMINPSNFQVEESIFRWDCHCESWKVQDIVPLTVENPVFKSNKKHILPWLQLIINSQAVANKRAVSVLQDMRIMKQPESYWPSWGFMAKGDQQQPTSPKKMPILDCVSFMHCHFISFHFTFRLCALAHTHKRGVSYML